MAPSRKADYPQRPPVFVCCYEGDFQGPKKALDNQGLIALEPWPDLPLRKFQYAISGFIGLYQYATTKSTYLHINISKRTFAMMTAHQNIFWTWSDPWFGIYSN